MDFNTNLNTNIETKHTIDLSDRLYKLPIAMITVVGLVGAGWVWSQLSALPQNQPHEINVSGEGKAYAKPDIAMISFGVTSQAVKSQDAVNQNNTKMNAVIAAIKGLGVQDKDIQTTLYSLNPIYGPFERRPESLIYPYPVSNKITGYTLDQQVQVKIRNFDNINSIIDKATAAGANTVGQLTFTVDDYEKVRDKAREKAIVQAKEKLKMLSKQSGLRVGKLINVSEGYGGYPPYPLYGLGGAGILEKDASVAPQIQTGQLEVNASITLTYQVR